MCKWETEREREKKCICASLCTKKKRIEWESEKKHSREKKQNQIHIKYNITYILFDCIQTIRKKNTHTPMFVVLVG